MATKVKLRQKKISGNRHSLYLDFYPAIPHPKTGELTRREFLGIYLDDNAKSPMDKQHNKDNLQLAQQIRNNRENQLNKSEVYSGFEKEQLRLKEAGEKNFVEYFKKLADKRKASNHDNWMSAYKYLESFTNGVLKFGDLNERFCNEFKEYLLTTKSNKSQSAKLSQNSAVSYFNKLKATLKQAYKDGYLANDLNAKVEQIKTEETRRNFLTLEELNKLVKTECQNPLMKQAALFSALTGLRFSDIQKLTWDEIEHVKGQGYFINFQQKKTKGIEVLPITEQAYELLGKRPTIGGQVFDGLRYSAYYNKHLYQWIGAAGITKDITFHCFRHTYATLLLNKGTDIYTVSKMLGHKDLKTTQIYTKVIDQKKRDAAEKIKLEF
ncbi:MAG: site-specific integrase [Bacteroidia bacterium]